jgi:hypothetical protein
VKPASEPPSAGFILAQNYSLACCSIIHSHSRLRASFGAPGSALFFLADDLAVEEVEEHDEEDEVDDDHDEEQHPEVPLQRPRRCCDRGRDRRHRGDNHLPRRGLSASR